MPTNPNPSIVWHTPPYPRPRPRRAPIHSRRRPRPRPLSPRPAAAMERGAAMAGFLAGARVRASVHYAPSSRFPIVSHRRQPHLRLCPPIARCRDPPSPSRSSTAARSAALQPLRPRGRLDPPLPLSEACRGPLPVARVSAAVMRPPTVRLRRLVSVAHPGLRTGSTSSGWSSSGRRW